ncbi:hypothetical protein [Candidatus Entotheonella palauensis]|nr:hypothetical protein [Candidatus Entotheonella palauensis]
MAEVPQKNAIERRIDYLSGLWNGFAEQPNARLLRWLVDSDTAPMVELFFEVQNEEIGDSPDLFIRFDEPFEEPQTYGFCLLETLRKQYEESRADIAEEQIATDWHCPKPLPDESGVAAFVRGCISFRNYYEELMLTLVLVLTPQQIANMEAWQAWLLTLVRSGLPTNVRVTVLDNSESPALNTLCGSDTNLITTVEAELDMPDALEELAEEAEGAGPGYEFRRHFVALTNAAATGDDKAVQKAATAALRIAAKHHWLAMQVVVHMTLGATALAADKPAEALASYCTAERVAATAEAQGEPEGSKLVLQSRLAQGAALVSGGHYAEAAQLYEGAVPLAVQQEDHLLTMESWRMAAYCYEMAKQREDAWRCGNEALEAGSRLDEDMRAHSTLAFIGQGLLRLTERRPYKKLADDIRQRITALLGPEWEKLAEVQETRP